MTTIVNRPQASNGINGSIGMLLGVVVLFLAAYLFFVYGLPALQKVQLGSPQINIPAKIDVNVNQTK